LALLSRATADQEDTDHIAQDRRPVERYLWLPLATIDPEKSAVLERLEHSTRRLKHALTGKFPSRPTMPKSL
jgi:hypothetical protein